MIFEKLYGKERDIIVGLVDVSDDDAPDHLRQRYSDFYEIMDELDNLKARGYVTFLFNVWGELNDFKVLTKGRSYLEVETNNLPIKAEQRSSNIVDTAKTETQHNSINIFVTHGHDKEMQSAVSNFIRKIGFNPIVLHEQPDGGRTIIEKFQDCADVSFAIILYSPDDEMKSGKMRARQNVLFEHGYFVAKLGLKKAVGLWRDPERIDIPSNLSGVIYKKFDDSWELAMAREMKHSGLDIDMNVFYDT